MVSCQLPNLVRTFCGLVGDRLEEGGDCSRLEEGGDCPRFTGGGLLLVGQASEPLIGGLGEGLEPFMGGLGEKLGEGDSPALAAGAWGRLAPLQGILPADAVGWLAFMTGILPAGSGGCLALMTSILPAGWLS